MKNGLAIFGNIAVTIFWRPGDLEMVPLSSTEFVLKEQTEK